MRGPRWGRRRKDFTHQRASGAIRDLTREKRNVKSIRLGLTNNESPYSGIRMPGRGSSRRKGPLPGEGTEEVGEEIAEQTSHHQEQRLRAKKNRRKIASEKSQKYSCSKVQIKRPGGGGGITDESQRREWKIRSDPV